MPAVRFCSPHRACFRLLWYRGIGVSGMVNKHLCSPRSVVRSGVQEQGTNCDSCLCWFSHTERCELWRCVFIPIICLGGNVVYITTVDTRLMQEASFVGLCIWLVLGSPCACMPSSSILAVAFMWYRLG